MMSLNHISLTGISSPSDKTRTSSLITLWRTIYMYELENSHKLSPVHILDVRTDSGPSQIVSTVSFRMMNWLCWDQLRKRNVDALLLSCMIVEWILQKYLQGMWKFLYSVTYDKGNKYLSSLKTGWINFFF